MMFVNLACSQTRGLDAGGLVCTPVVQLAGTLEVQWGGEGATSSPARHTVGTF